MLTRAPEYFIFKLNRDHDLGENKIKYSIDLDIPIHKLRLLNERYDLISVVTSDTLEP